MIRKAIVLGVAFSLLTLAGAAHAQRVQSTSITARLIQAKAEGPVKIDPALADIEKKLKRSAFKYQQYELISKQGGAISAGATLKLRFPDNMVLEATFLGGTRDQLEFSLRWTRRIPKQRPLEYFNMRKKFKEGEVLVMAGPKSDGGVLLLAVTAQ